MATPDESPNSAASKTSPNSAATVLNPGLTKNPLSFNSAAFPVKLTPTNYMSWRAQFTSLLAGYELDGCLDGRNPCPVATAPEYSLWARQDQLLRHALITSVSENITPYIAAAATAQQAWETLARLYANCSQSRVITLKERLQNMRRDGWSVANYLINLKTVADELGTIDRPLNDDDLTVYILNGLGPEFREIAASLRARDSSLSFDDLHDRLVAHEESLKREEACPEITPVTAHYAAVSFHSNTDSSSSLSAGNSHSSLGCHPLQGFCGNRNGCQLYGRAGHFARNCPSYRVQALGPMANLASSSPAFSEDCLLDSGANNHVTTDLANLALHSEYNGPDELHIGDGTSLQITHVGHSTLSTPQSSLPLRNDCYTNETLLQGPTVHGIYQIPRKFSSKPTALVGERTSLAIWHLRLGYSIDNLGYKCLDLSSRKLFFSRHVVFDESTFPHKSQSIIPILPSTFLHANESSSTSTSGLDLSNSPSSLASPIDAPHELVAQEVPLLVASPSSIPSPILCPAPLSEPTCVTQALKDPNWRRAMSEEFSALVHQDGSIERYKARLVAKGFHQRPGSDYFNTFSPVIKPTTIRTVLSIAISQQWVIRQLDINNAFLHGHLEEQLFMQQPAGFVDPRFPQHVCKLRKSIYGLKRAPRAWFNELKSFIISQGFSQSKSDSSLFILHKGSTWIYFLIYVDDIIITRSDSSTVQSLIQIMGARFSLKDLGPLNFFLGVEAIPTAAGLFLSQHRYITDLLQQYNMHEVKPVPTSLAASTSLHLGSGSPLFDGSIYRRLLGSLQYLALTRPDLCFAVNKLSQFMHQPTDAHCSTEAKYRALASVASELVWVRNLLSKLGVSGLGSPALFCDNIGATYLSLNPVPHSRMKHIAVDLHFVRDLVEKNVLHVSHISSHDQLADGLTKALSTARFSSLRSKIGVADGTSILRGRVKATASPVVTTFNSTLNQFRCFCDGGDFCPPQMPVVLASQFDTPSTPPIPDPILTPAMCFLP
ncbi:hypothetical protein SLEP1_g50561 [Rubroshorea leprosula]|uniref:Retrovirus-related Pol polyprotein from transposon RE1 n=1 Tax=Rubroshorea leprosula TaxID=152421 RepID=A0AAV5M173_9ROSI|nr:hypothetical protein SLEP1_g50561 [Rubroshorea leprosula]